MLALPLPCAVRCFALSRRVISYQEVLAVATGSWQLYQSAFRSITEDNPAADSQTQERPFSSLFCFCSLSPLPTPQTCSSTHGYHLLRGSRSKRKRIALYNTTSSLCRKRWPTWQTTHLSSCNLHFAFA